MECLLLLVEPRETLWMEMTQSTGLLLDDGWMHHHFVVVVVAWLVSYYFRFLCCY